MPQALLGTSIFYVQPPQNVQIFRQEGTWQVVPKQELGNQDEDSLLKRVGESIDPPPKATFHPVYPGGLPVRPNFAIVSIQCRLACSRKASGPPGKRSRFNSACTSGVIRPWRMSCSPAWRTRL